MNYIHIQISSMNFIHIQIILIRATVLNLSRAKKITGTEAEPYIVVLECFEIFKNVVRSWEVVNSLELGETPSYSASHKAPNYAKCFLIL